MSSEDETNMITLRSNDGKEFKISNEAARISGFCVDTLNLDEEQDDEDAGEGQTNRIVDVLRVSGECLERVVEFMLHYSKSPMPEISLPMCGNSFEEVSNI